MREVAWPWRQVERAHRKKAVLFAILPNLLVCDWCGLRGTLDCGRDDARPVVLRCDVEWWEVGHATAHSGLASSSGWSS